MSHYLEPEIEKALRLANKLLDESHTDPDDDLRMLARQLIRTKEGRDYYENFLSDLQQKLSKMELTPQQYADKYWRANEIPIHETTGYNIAISDVLNLFPKK